MTVRCGVSPATAQASVPSSSRPSSSIGACISFHTSASSSRRRAWRSASCTASSRASSGAIDSTVNQPSSLQ